MHHARLAFGLLFLGPSLGAQSFGYITPVGAEFFEGNSASDIMLGNWAANTRTQQIDNNLAGRSLPLLRYIGWRRDGNTASPGAPKTTDVTVLMSHADYNTITNTFASNYKTPPQTVFTKKAVNLPSWNVPPATLPAPFDVVLPLDVPFLYNGQDALLWDVLNENNPLGIYTQDWVSVTTHTYGDYSTDLSGGCSTANGSMTHRCALRATATTLEMGVKVTAAPSAAGVLLLIGASDPNLPVPGLCGTVHAQPLVFLPIGAADGAGTLPLAFPVSTPWTPAFAGAALFTQALAVDVTQPGIPVVLSNGLKSPFPSAGGPGPINIKRIYHTSSSTALVGTGPAVSAVATYYAY